MKRKRTSEMNASISLESALVMPVVIYVILISFYFLLFMYNRSVCQDAALLAARQTLYCEDETNLRIERAVSDKCKEALDGAFEDPTFLLWLADMLAQRKK